MNLLEKKEYCGFIKRIMKVLRKIKRWIINYIYIYFFLLAVADEDKVLFKGENTYVLNAFVINIIAAWDKVSLVFWKTSLPGNYSMLAIELVLMPFLALFVIVLFYILFF